MDQTKYEHLKAQHGAIVVIEIGEHHAVFKRANRTQYSRFRETVKDNHVAAGSALLADTLVSPTWEEFVKILNEAPALEDEIVGQVIELAKGAHKLEAKKY